MKNRTFWDDFWNVVMLTFFAINVFMSSRLADDEIWLGALYYLGVAFMFLTIFFIVNWRPRKKT